MYLDLDLRSGVISFERLFMHDQCIIIIHCKYYMQIKCSIIEMFVF